jgi:hypothetical protein
VNFWINTVSQEHVLAGAAGGFTQADHGREIHLKRLAQGDYLVFYSPRTHFQAGEPLQVFTALGQVQDGIPYQVQMTSDFAPYRRRVAYLPCQPAPIRPLIPSLSFIQDKQHWGYPFRRGLFAIPEADFRLIAAAMGAQLE